jgi:hypothetical protein
MTRWSQRSPRNRLYAGLIGIGGAGVVWLVVDGATDGTWTPCLFKHLTGIPCPACGSTRAVLALFRGEDVLAYNPLGIVTLAAASLALAMLCRDLATGSDSLFRSWRSAERFVRQPLVAAAGIAVMASNWMWAIARGL